MSVNQFSMAISRSIWIAVLLFMGCLFYSCGNSNQSLEGFISPVGTEIGNASEKETDKPVGTEIGNASQRKLNGPGPHGPGEDDLVDDDDIDGGDGGGRDANTNKTTPTSTSDSLETTGKPGSTPQAGKDEDNMGGGEVGMPDKADNPAIPTALKGFDTDRNNSLSAGERTAIEEALAKVGAILASGNKVDDERFDLNGDGSVTSDEIDEVKKAFAALP